MNQLKRRMHCIFDFKAKGMNTCKTKVVTLLFLAIITFVFGSANAKEGFNTLPSSLPPKLQTAWNQVFQIFIKRPDSQISTGSSIFLRKIPISNSKVKLLFVTNEHVVTAHCPQINPRCNKIILSDLITTVDGNVAEDPTYVLNAEVVVLQPEYDLALLSVVVLRKELPHSFIDLSGPHLNCRDDHSLHPLDSLYNIGFPALNDRYSVDQVADSLILKKRWSVGAFVDRYFKINHQFPKISPKAVFEGSTADSLEGLSGGGVFDDDSQLVGVVKATASTNENNYIYDGNETVGKLSFQTLYIPCVYLKKMLDDYLLNVSSQVPN